MVAVELPYSQCPGVKSIRTFRHSFDPLLSLGHPPAKPARGTSHPILDMSSRRHAFVRMGRKRPWLPTYMYLLVYMEKRWRLVTGDTAASAAKMPATLYIRDALRAHAATNSGIDDILRRNTSL